MQSEYDCFGLSGYSFFLLHYQRCVHAAPMLLYVYVNRDDIMHAHDPASPYAAWNGWLCSMNVPTTTEKVNAFTSEHCLAFKSVTAHHFMEVTYLTWVGPNHKITLRTFQVKI